MEKPRTALKGHVLEKKKKREDTRKHARTLPDFTAVHVCNPHHCEHSKNSAPAAPGVHGNAYDKEILVGAKSQVRRIAVFAEQKNNSGHEHE